MAYFKPSIDQSGAHIPHYNDIKESLIEGMKDIHGQDIYLENDSQDYQQISIISERIADLLDFGVLIYNNRGPASAIGGGLDGIVRLNGIRRKGAGHSIVILTINGKPGTVISKAKVSDSYGNLWSIDDSITIPSNGEIDVQAMCDIVGKIYAEPNSVTRIMTPKQGWTSVTNKSRAIVGNDVETDAELRARQKISVARPSRTVLLGTWGGIMELPDVTRAKLYENDTNIFGFYGEPIPGHSICAVVEGGNDFDIATEIYYRKDPGCGTYGDISVSVTDEMESYPIEAPPIKFYRPKYVDVYVKVILTPKYGFVSQTKLDIHKNIIDYLNGLQIGSSLVLSALYTPINNANKNINEPSFSISQVFIGKSEDTMEEKDISIAFNESTRGIDTHIQIEVL